jgi:tight adherence protein C
MTRPLLVGGGIFLAVVVVASIALLQEIDRRDRLAARIRGLHGQVPRQPANPDALRATLLKAVSGIGQWTLKRGLLPAGTLSELEQMLAASGLRGANALNLFIGGKIVLAAGLPLLTFLLAPKLGLPPPMGRLLLVGAAILGLVLPDYVLGAQRKAYLKKLEAGLPDALDMMVICTQAGISMGAAIVHVSAELGHVHPEISQEFAQTANELSIMADSRVALTNLGQRTGLNSLKRLGATLVQAQQYGTPISDALRILSGEMRQEMLTRFEARAARLGVLLTLPTLLFILPCVFMIAGGPAAIQVVRMLGKH